MGNVISNFAFQYQPSSYDRTLPLLEFVERETMGYSRITTYKIPIRHYQRDKKLPSMIVCHGSSEDIGEASPVALSEEFNVNICLFDYSGYGLHSYKIASEYSCQEDVVAVYNYLINHKRVPQNFIIIYGRSLGTGVAIYLSFCLCKQQIYNRLILVSPLYSAAATVTDLWIPGDIFRNYLLAPEIQSKTLILHGNDDDIVPYMCGKKLSTLFPNLHEFVTLKDCSHNDVCTEKYYRKIRKFVGA